MRLLTLFLCFLNVTVYSQSELFTLLKNDSVSVFVKDSTEYSKEFLNEILRWNSSNTYILNDDSLIINRDYEYGIFNTLLELNKTYRYKGKNQFIAIDLTVERINYSTLKYSVINEFRFSSSEFVGFAHGGVSIYGEESDSDDRTNASYFCSEYFDDSTDKNLYIRIDSENADKAKIIFNLDDVVLLLKDCPTLYLVEK